MRDFFWALLAIIPWAVLLLCHPDDLVMLYNMFHSMVTR